MGRTYQLAYTAFDRAGNGTPCTATVRVPRNPGSGGGGATALAPSPESATTPGSTAAPASWFTFGRTRLDGRALRVILRLPGEGTLRIRGVVRTRGAKAVKLRARRVAAGAGRTRLRLRVPAAAWRAIDRAGRGKVIVRVAYRPKART